MFFFVENLRVELEVVQKKTTLQEWPGIFSIICCVIGFLKGGVCKDPGSSSWFFCDSLKVPLFVPSYKPPKVPTIDG